MEFTAYTLILIIVTIGSLGIIGLTAVALYTMRRDAQTPRRPKVHKSASRRAPKMGKDAHNFDFDWDTWSGDDRDLPDWAWLDDAGGWDGNPNLRNKDTPTIRRRK